MIRFPYASRYGKHAYIIKGDCMKKKPVMIGTVIVVVIVIIVAVLFKMSSYGPSFSEVKHLVQPRIISKPDTRAFVVEATGEPNVTVGPAFSLLFKTWFSLKNRPKGKDMPAPRARWPKHFETPRNEWIGIYAIPIPSVAKIPADLPAKNGLMVEVRDWHYGEVAEILHVGPYASEDTTVAKLKKFITEQGYEINGAHEEEYLKGPGFMPTNPEKYLTIIRYQVKKRASDDTQNEPVHQ